MIMTLLLCLMCIAWLISMDDGVGDGDGDGDGVGKDDCGKGKKKKDDCNDME